MKLQLLQQWLRNECCCQRVWLQLEGMTCCSASSCRVGFSVCCWKSCSGTPQSHVGCKGVFIMHVSLANILFPPTSFVKSREQCRIELTLLTNLFSLCPFFSSYSECKYNSIKSAYYIVTWFLGLIEFFKNSCNNRAGCSNDKLVKYVLFGLSCVIHVCDWQYDDERLNLSHCSRLLFNYIQWWNDPDYLWKKKSLCL